MSTLFATGSAQENSNYLCGKVAAETAYRKLGSQRPDLAILFSEAGRSFQEISEGIKSIIGEVPIVGCTSAGSFTETQTVESGVSLALISSDNHQFFPAIGENLHKDQIKTVKSLARQFPKKVEGFPHYSAMLFFDGLIGKGEETALAASSVLGPLVKLSGAAAADNFRFQQTEVFGKDKSKTDALSLCYIASRAPIAIGLKHGHKPISPSLRVTKARHNVIYEIENRPALDVWNTYVQAPTENKEELFQYLLKHQIGLLMGNDYKIRFPIAVNSDKSLSFGSLIYEGSVIKIMDSQPYDQILALKKATEMALEEARGVPIAGAVVFNCSCMRSLLAHDQHYTLALNDLKKTLKDIPFIGLGTYGEIAMEPGQMSGFHNATTVVMLIPK